MSQGKEISRPRGQSIAVAGVSAGRPGNARLTFDQANLKLAYWTEAVDNRMNLARCQGLPRHRLRPKGKGLLIAIPSTPGDGQVMACLATERGAWVKSKQLTIEGIPFPADAMQSAKNEK